MSRLRADTVGACEQSRDHAFELGQNAVRKMTGESKLVGHAVPGPDFFLSLISIMTWVLFFAEYSGSFSYPLFRARTGALPAAAFDLLRNSDSTEPSLTDA